MHNCARARTEFDGADVTVFRESSRNREVSIDVGTARRHFERLWHLENQIGFAELPTVRERRYLRHLRRVSARHPLRDPLTDRLNLFIRQSPLVGEIAEAVLGVPRRHVPRLGHVRDQRAALCHVLITDERKRRGFAWPMAGDAVLIKDRRDVFAECHSARFLRG